MSTVTLSPKYQVVIPKEVRKRFSLAPGDQIAVLDLGDRIELVPLAGIGTGRGLLKGYDTSFQREKVDRDIG